MNKNIHLPIWLLLYLLSFSRPSFGIGTGRIVGRVTDAETGKGLRGVEIRLLEGIFKTLTDLDGNYSLLDIPAGSYTLVASLEDYIPVRMEETIVASDFTTRVDIPLSRRAGSYIIYEEEIRRRSIEELIADQPGVIESGSRTSREIHLRGGYRDDIVYFLDGRRIYDPGLIDNDIIDYLHLTKGRFTPEYGDAPTGIVLLRTKEESKLGGKFELGTDRLPSWSYDFGYTNVNLTFGGVVPGAEAFSFLVSGDLLDQSRYELNEEKADEYYESLLKKGSVMPLPHNDLSQRNGMIRLSWRPLANIETALHGFWAKRKYHLYNHPYSKGAWLRDQPLYERQAEQFDFSLTHRLSSTCSYTIGLSRFDSDFGYSPQDGRHYNEFRAIGERLAWVSNASGRGWWDPEWRIWDEDAMRRESGLRKYFDAGFEPEEIAWMYWYEDRGYGHLDEEANRWIWDGESHTEKLRHAYEALNNRYYEVNSWQFVIDQNGDTVDIYYHLFDLDKYIEDIRRYIADPEGFPEDSIEPSGNMYLIRYNDDEFGDFRYYFRPSWHRSNATLYTIDFSLNSRVGKNHQIRFGGDFRKHYLNATDVQFVNANPYIYKIDDTLLTASAYIQDKIEYGMITAIGGIRYDYFKPVPDSVLSRYWILYYLESRSSMQVLSPRIALSVRPTHRFLISGSYGHFYQIPPTIDNPNPSRERTVAYEIGLKYILPLQTVLEINGYYKDAGKPKVIIRQIGPIGYIKYENQLITKGVDLVLKTEALDYLTAWVNYSYLDERCKTFSPPGYYYTSGASPIEHPTEFGDNHSCKIDLNLSLPEGFGPRLWTFQPLSNMDVNIRHNYQSGIRYTPVDSRDNPLEPYSGKMPSTQWTDMSIDKYFNVDGIRLGLFLDVRNLLNRENVLNVYPMTGKPDDDGDPPQWEPSMYQNYEEHGYSSPWEYYQAHLSNWRLYVKDPTNYGNPRTVRIGLFIKF